MSKKIKTLRQRFDRMSIRMNDGDLANKQESTQSDALLVSVISALLSFVLR